MMNIHKELPLSFPGCPPSPDPSPPFTQISRHYRSYVPGFAIGGAFLIAWLAPLSIFFWLFAAFYGSLEGIWWVLWAYWVLLLNRLSGLRHAPTAGEKGLLWGSLWIQAGFWMLFGFITARARGTRPRPGRRGCSGALYGSRRGSGCSSASSRPEPIPELGVTQEVVRAEVLSGGGAFIAEPHRILAFGFLYFTTVTIVELVTGYLRAKHRTPERT